MDVHGVRSSRRRRWRSWGLAALGAILVPLLGGALASDGELRGRGRHQGDGPDRGRARRVVPEIDRAGIGSARRSPPGRDLARSRSGSRLAKRRRDLVWIQQRPRDRPEHDRRRPPRPDLGPALPHEITHTIFADYFGEPMPRWADEGASLLSEDQARAAARHDQIAQDLLRAPGRDAAARLFKVEEYPNDLMGFYGQGYSISRFLVEMGGRPRFLCIRQARPEIELGRMPPRSHYGTRRRPRARSSLGAPGTRSSPRAEPSRMAWSSGRSRRGGDSDEIRPSRRVPSGEGSNTRVLPVCMRSISARNPETDAW